MFEISHSTGCSIDLIQYKLMVKVSITKASFRVTM